MPGFYEFCPPDASLDAGVGKVASFWCGGAVAMSPVVLQVRLSPPTDVVSLAADTITASAIATDAIGAAEIAADAIGDAEVAADGH